MSTPPSWLPASGSGSDPYASPLSSGFEAPLPFGQPQERADPYAAPAASPQDDAPGPAPTGYDAPTYPPAYGQAPPYGQPTYPPPYGHPQPHYGPGPSASYASWDRTNGLATASLVTAIVSVFTVVSAPVAIVLGIMALNAIKRDGSRGRGLAITGIVIGSVIIVGIGLVLLLMAVIFASAGM